MSPVLAEKIAAEIGDVVDPGCSMRPAPGSYRGSLHDLGQGSMLGDNVIELRDKSASNRGKPGKTVFSNTVTPADKATTRRPRDILLEAGISERQAEAFLNTFQMLRCNSIKQEEAEKSLVVAGFTPIVATELVSQIVGN